MPPQLFAALVELDRLVERHLAALEPAHDVLERLERLLESHRGDIGARLIHACGVAMMQAGVKRGGFAANNDLSSLA
jgi:hypothetical protein